MREKIIQRKNATKTGGFTLVETLVAIAILMIAIAGPLTIAEKGLSAAIYARDQLIGSYLAQDGMEYIKNAVYANEIQIGNGTYQDTGDQWISGAGHDLSGFCTSSTPCVIDTMNGTIAVSQCPNSNPSLCPPLYLGLSGYTMTQGSNTPTNFTRYFYVVGSNVNGGSSNNTYNAASVVVTVTWPGDAVGGGGVTLEDTLFDAPIQ